ncbi:hypothetical protein [Methylomagnum sp.]
MRSNAEYLRAFRELGTDLTALAAEQSDEQAPARFSPQDKSRVIALSKEITELANKEILLIEDFSAPNSPDPDRLKARLFELYGLIQDDNFKRYFSIYIALIDEYLNDLLTKVRRSMLTRTLEDEVRLMKNAGILDEDGYYSPKIFSEETVARDRARGNVKVA